MRRFAPAMREIVVDTKTIGLDPLDGHRIFEIGAVDLINPFPRMPNLSVENWWRSGDRGLRARATCAG